METNEQDEWWVKTEGNLPVPYIRNFSIIIANGHFAAAYETLGGTYNSCRSSHYGNVEELAQHLRLELTGNGVELGGTKLSLQQYEPTHSCNGPSSLGSYGSFIPH